MMSLSGDIWAEHRFGLKVMTDHLDFIIDALPKFAIHQQKDLETLKNEIKILSQRIGQDLDAKQFSRQVLVLAERVGIIKRHFLKLKLTENYALKMDPTFINHMLNELEEYIAIINGYILEGRVPMMANLHYHKIWLLDAEGHMATIKKYLDPIEKELRKQVTLHKNKFHHLYDKALELIGYLRAVDSFPELKQFDSEAVIETRVYLDLLAEIAEMWQEGYVQGMLTPQILEHMMFEQSYYLYKLGYLNEF